MQGPNDSTFTQIWPSPGREQLALQLGAIERDGLFFLDPARNDENAGKLKRMFGSTAARRLRESAALNEARKENGAATAEPASQRRTLSLGAQKPLVVNDRIAVAPSATPANPADNTSFREASFAALLFDEPQSWRWSDVSAEIGGTPGAVFVPVKAEMIPGARPRIEITVDNDLGNGQVSRQTISIEADPKNAQKSLDAALRRFLEDPARRQRVAAGAAAVRNANEVAKHPAPEHAPSHSAIEAQEEAADLLDLILASTGGAKGPAIAWRGDSLERPATSALTGMRGVVTSGRMNNRLGGAKTLKLVIDYRAFATQNAAIAQAAGKKGPGSFETISIQIPAFEAGDINQISRKIAGIFELTQTPQKEVEPGQKSASAERKGDERLLMAKAANAEVERRGETPPAPIPPVNASDAATRVFFWTAREESDPYCYKKLLEAAAEAKVALLVDRASGSPTWGLRYIEATQAQVAALPETMTRFFSQAAQESHLASKGRRDSSRALVADAAATAAIEVTTKREATPETKPETAPKAPEQATAETKANATAAAGQVTPQVSQQPASAAEQDATPPAPKPLRPLSVPHPEHDRDGWFRARAAIRNIEPNKLVKLIDLTVEMHEDLEVKKDMKRTIGEDLDADDMTRLTTWRHGINLAKEALLARGVRYQAPDKRQEKDFAVQPEAPAKQPRQQTHDRSDLQIER